MKKIQSKYFGLYLILVLTSCTSDFGDMNVDPNNPSDALPDLLLTSALQSVSSVAGAVTGALYVQYLAETQYTEDSRYGTEQFDFTYWYTSPLNDCETIINSSATANYKAAARITKAYFYHMMTDRWGMLPYSQALQGAENFQPAYDTQEAIYKGLIVDLTEAVTLFDVNSSLNGDILLGGDVARWAQWGNTLRMVMALRLSDIDPAYAQDEYDAAIAAGVIDMDVMYAHLAEDANASPWYTRFVTRTDYAISNTMDDAMTAKGDLRLLKYADPAPDAVTAGATGLDLIVGMTYGISNGDAGDIMNQEISFPGMAIRSQDSPLPVYTVAQVHFSKAEAALLGWGGDAAAEYDLGVSASFTQWGVDGSADYLTANPYIDINSIAYEKWVAAFPQGYEAWAEWRRLDSPALTPAINAQNTSGNIPVRHAYVQTESELNADNYNAAVSLQGADVLDTKLWWDVN
jgi:hypothetical protein